MSQVEPGEARPAGTLAPLRRLGAGLLLALTFGGLAGWGTSFVLPASFRSESTHAVLSSSGGGSSGLAGLGGLAGLPGLTGATGGRVNLDQAIALIQTDDTLDAIITTYRLGELWQADDPAKLRRTLKKRLRLWVGQKDQLVRIEATMPDAELAARVSNDLGQRLAARTTELASAEARNRRQTLEGEVRRSQAALQAAQQQLVRAQLNPSQMRADSRSTAELMTRLQSELGAIEARLAAAATVLTSDSAEMRQMLATRHSLRARLDSIRSPAPSADFGYTEAFREYKYQEAVLEILLRQYETARIDEVKGGQYVHAVQVARPSKRPAFPDPALLIATGSLLLALLYGATVFVRHRRANAG